MANDRDSGKLEEKLACSICLDTFATPVTVPCGHSFCVECISKHWDKHEQESAAGQNYSCPECRESFPERPKVSKNVKLDSLVEVFKLREVQVSGAEKLKDVRGRKCPRHARPLELYCRTEKQCICCECSVKECKNHQKVLLEEERKMKEVS